MGHADYLWFMFVRKNKNRSGSVSVQIVEKINRVNRLLKTVGIAGNQREEDLLTIIAANEIERLKGQAELFVDHDDLVVESFVESLSSSAIQWVGSDLILSKIYAKIGYPEDGSCAYFKALVLARLVFPKSKLKTVKFLQANAALPVGVHTIYSFMDTLQERLHTQIEDITYTHATSIEEGRVAVVFYDMTSLYFEASQEDEFRIPGYSKDGKHQNPQILIGLVINASGFPLGYHVFEGNKAETKTLIPVIEAFCERFNLPRPIVVADAALLSKKNIEALQNKKYTYILGGRLKNESDPLKQTILHVKPTSQSPKELPHRYGRLIVTYSHQRAKKDKRNREKGLARLEKKVTSGKLTKKHINNRGYNKYLKLQGEATVWIDRERFEADAVWDGLKGYITNTDLAIDEVVDQYKKLWNIERAFRISKTDLRIRPIYHRLKNRILAHICICFAAYTVYKELERQLHIQNTGMSVETAIEEIRQIKQLTYRLPKSKQIKTKILAPTPNQEILLNLNL